MKSAGSALIENLYATVIALFWPVIYLSSKSKPILFDLTVETCVVVFSFMFICDDYYSSQKALGHPNLNPAPWRNTLRYWLDIFILLCFFGFTLAFEHPILVYLIIGIFLLSWIWCRTLSADYKKNNLTVDSYQSVYTNHLTRQQFVYFLVIACYVISSVLEKLLSLLIHEGDIYQLDYSKLTKEMFVVAIDNNLVSLLWVMIGGHWIASTLATVRMSDEFKKFSWVVNLLIIVLRFPPFRWLANNFVKLVQPRWVLLVLVGSILMAFMQPTLRASILMFCIVGWYILEVVTGSGLFYESVIAQSAQAQAANDPVAVSSAIRFIKKLSDGDSGEGKS